jgi:hypothetical protein
MIVFRLSELKFHSQTITAVFARRLSTVYQTSPNAQKVRGTIEGTDGNAQLFVAHHSVLTTTEEAAIIKWVCQ